MEVSSALERVQEQIADRAVEPITMENATTRESEYRELMARYFHALVDEVQGGGTFGFAENLSKEQRERQRRSFARMIGEHRKRWDWLFAQLWAETVVLGGRDGLRKLMFGTPGSPEEERLLDTLLGHVWPMLQRATAEQLVSVVEATLRSQLVGEKIDVYQRTFRLVEALEAVDVAEVWRAIRTPPEVTTCSLLFRDAALDVLEHPVLVSRGDDSGAFEQMTALLVRLHSPETRDALLFLADFQNLENPERMSDGKPQVRFLSIVVDKLVEMTLRDFALEGEKEIALPIIGRFLERIVADVRIDEEGFPLVAFPLLHYFAQLKEGKPDALAEYATAQHPGYPEALIDVVLHLVGVDLALKRHYPFVPRFNPKEPKPIVALVAWLNETLHSTYDLKPVALGPQDTESAAVIGELYELLDLQIGRHTDYPDIHLIEYLLLYVSRIADYLDPADVRQQVLQPFLGQTFRADQLTKPARRLLRKIDSIAHTKDGHDRVFQRREGENG